MDYKDKLERAKELYETANKDQKYVLESLFPELQEEKDERIIKKLKGVVMWAKNYSASGITSDEAEEMIAWLDNC